VKATLAPSMSVSPGGIIAGKYRVDRVLGSGGMGIVVAATHVELDQRVAIKLLRPEHLARGGAVERVLREARAAVKIASLHVARVYDVGTLDDGVPFIVMELLEGCDLAQLLCAEGHIPVEDAAAWIIQACDALARAHALGIVHRDLKPANLFLASLPDESTSIKVLDFGISKYAAGVSGRVEEGLTSTTALLGSPVYMSPEQLESTRDVDARTDIWSLGVILYELVTGAHPFVADTLPQLCKKIAEREAPPLRDALKDAPEALEGIVTRCLRKRREDRFPDVQSLAAALAPLARPPAEAEPSSRLASIARSGERARAGASGAQPALGRRRLSRSLGTVAAVAILGTAALALTARPGGSDAASMARPNASAAGAPGALLAATGSVLACPPLKTVGGDEPSDWLGAAASTLACMRAQVRMGARSARTLFAAELLGLPAAPVDGFPEDPWGVADARDRALAAAKARASAYLDGTIAPAKEGLHVELSLRASADGRELARGQGTGLLLAAVREAMAPFEQTGAIPSVPDGDPFLREWYRATTTDGAVATADMFLAANLGWLKAEKEECERYLARTDVLPDGLLARRAGCAEPGGKEAPPAPRLDTSSPGAVVASIEADAHPSKRPLQPDLDALETALERARGHEERAFLYGEEAFVYETHGDGDGANRAALQAVHEDPKAFGVGRSGWASLSWVRGDSNAAPAANAWAPWQTEVYCFAAMRTTDLDLKLRFARRDATLSPGRIWKDNLAEFLVLAGRRDEARSVAAQVGWDGLDILVDASDARFGKALARMKPLLAKKELSAFLAGYAVNSAAFVAMILGRDADYMNAFVSRYVAASPSEIEGDLWTTYTTTVACTVAPKDAARQCLARVRAFTLGPVAWTDGLLEGAERYVEGDWAGATRAWRPMLAHPGWQLDFMRDVVATAFERAAEDDLVEKLDAPILGYPGRYNGAELAHVRAARRAARRGDKDTARKMARRVIDAWSVADEQVPAVDEMRKLIARLD
jgi:eukaryotic-like serine/threonine-protein kinase